MPDQPVRPEEPFQARAVKAMSALRGRVLHELLPSQGGIISSLIAVGKLGFEQSLNEYLVLAKLSTGPG